MFQGQIAQLSSVIKKIKVKRWIEERIKERRVRIEESKLRKLIHNAFLLESNLNHILTPHENGSKKFLLKTLELNRFETLF